MNDCFADILQEKIDNLNKPKGSLGRLESLALQIGLIQHSLTPSLNNPCHILFAADHGIEREGVSVAPREVTWQQMVNFGCGGGGVNMFCRQHGFKLRLVDVGVDHDFAPEGESNVINRKIAYGTQDFLFGPAMGEEEYGLAMKVGAEMVDECHAEGCNVISFGEMGIGNTSPSSVWMHLLADIPLQQCVGAGSGLNTEGQRHKLDVLQRAVDNYRLHHSDISPLRYFGGFEMIAAVGGMLRAAEHKMIVLVDGFIMTACMLAASTLNAGIMPYAVFGHCGDEAGHRLMLNAMGAEPLLSLGMRLGEGTGAICAYPLLQSAVNMLNEMNNFDTGQITKYF